VAYQIIGRLPQQTNPKNLYIFYSKDFDDNYYGPSRDKDPNEIPEQGHKGVQKAYEFLVEIRKRGREEKELEGSLK
jgi:hypothetical protein